MEHTRTIYYNGALHHSLPNPLPKDPRWATARRLWDAYKDLHLDMETYTARLSGLTLPVLENDFLPETQTPTAALKTALRDMRREISGLAYLRRQYKIPIANMFAIRYDFFLYRRHLPDVILLVIGDSFNLSIGLQNGVLYKTHQSAVDKLHEYLAEHPYGRLGALEREQADAGRDLCAALQALGLPVTPNLGLRQAVAMLLLHIEFQPGTATVDKLATDFANLNNQQ